VKNVAWVLFNLKLEEIYATCVRLECFRVSLEDLSVVIALLVLFNQILARVFAVYVLWGKYSGNLAPRRVKTVLLVLLRLHQDKRSVSFVRLASLFGNLHKHFASIVHWAIPVMRDPRIASSVRSDIGLGDTKSRMVGVNW